MAIPYAGKTLLVIGGGAAGFFCAVNAAQFNPSLRVIILEKSSKLLSKVKLSGGGRCNLTHSCFDRFEMLKNYPRGGNFLKKLFYQFFTTDTVEWFKKRGIALKTEADGRMFPVTDSSQTIVNCLLQEAYTHQVIIRLNEEVKSIEWSRPRFKVGTAVETFEADYICLATGGLSKSGMMAWLRPTGHSLVNPVPSLFTFNIPGHPITGLMGVAVNPVRVKIKDTKLSQEGPLLITHWGLSGPCILRLSAWAARELAIDNWKFRILINWLPAYNEQQLKDEFSRLRLQLAAQNLYHKNPFKLPQRLWVFLLDQSGISTATRWADLPAKVQNVLIGKLVSYTCEVTGKTTFKEEFVTAGGIKLSEIDPNTMMSKKIPNLFFAGEVIDVDGITGGFNFQNAWSTGFVAAKTISSLSLPH